MTPVDLHRLKLTLDALLEVMRSNWLWPSPETGFARHVFTAACETVPVASEDGGLWPNPNRLDEAPILATAGYIISERPQEIRQDQHQSWADGLELLKGKNPFSTLHASFAYRPTELLGIAFGAVACTSVQRTQVDWLRSVVGRLRSEQTSADPWCELLYGMAAATLGEKWHSRLLFDLSGAKVEVLALLQWLLQIENTIQADMAAGRQRIDIELLSRLKNFRIPRDVGRAALIFHALSQANANRILPTLEPDIAKYAVKRHSIELDFSPRTLASMPSGMGINLTFVTGDQNMGDKISVGGNVTGSALGTGASAVVGDISAFQNMVATSTHLTTDLKTGLTAAREAVEHTQLPDGDKKDVLDDLGKLTEEMEKPNPEPGRVARFFSRIKEIAPSVASILSSTATIAKVIGEVTGHG